MVSVFFCYKALWRARERRRDGRFCLTMGIKIGKSCCTGHCAGTMEKTWYNCPVERGIAGCKMVPDRSSFLRFESSLAQRENGFVQSRLNDDEAQAWRVRLEDEEGKRRRKRAGGKMHTAFFLFWLRFGVSIEEIANAGGKCELQLKDDT